MSACNFAPFPPVQIPPPLPIPKYKPPSFAVTFSIGIEVAPLGLEPPQIPPPLPIPKIKIPGVPPTVRYCPLDGTITVG